MRLLLATVLVFAIMMPITSLCQTINIDKTNPLIPVVSVQISDTVLSDSLGLVLAKKRLKMFLVFDGKRSTVAVDGRYSYEKEKLTFKPYNPLGENLNFEIQYQFNGTVEQVYYTTPKAVISESPLPFVEAVFPSSTTLPKNILFFHVRFSAPMENDIYAYKSVKILDDSSRVIPSVWRQRSYWIDSQKVLVLMVHPGKVKRGINMEIPFEVGKSYTLRIEKTLKDINGRFIEESFDHLFTISDVDYEIPKILFDKFVMPEANSKNAITLRFSEGMDHASIIDGVVIHNSNNDRIDGSFSWDTTDREYKFYPTAKWEPGKYLITFQKKVCDFANNRLNRPFEISQLKDIEKDNIPVTYSFEL